MLPCFPVQAYIICTYLYNNVRHRSPRIQRSFPKWRSGSGDLLLFLLEQTEALLAAVLACIVALLILRRLARSPAKGALLCQSSCGQVRMRGRCRIASDTQLVIFLL